MQFDLDVRVLAECSEVRGDPVESIHHAQRRGIDHHRWHRLARVERPHDVGNVAAVHLVSWVQAIVQNQTSRFHRRGSHRFHPFVVYRALALPCQALPGRA